MSSVADAVKVWDVETGRKLCTLRGHEGFVRGASLSRNGRRAASASNDRTLKVWDVETGEAIAIFTSDSTLYCCSFTTDDHLVAGDAGGQVHFLHLEEPKSRS